MKDLCPEVPSADMLVIKPFVELVCLFVAEELFVVIRMIGLINSLVREAAVKKDIQKRN